MIPYILIGLGVVLVAGVVYFLGVFDGVANDSDAGPTQLSEDEDNDGGAQ